jgi:hypothetical protein
MEINSSKQKMLCLLKKIQYPLYLDSYILECENLSLTFSETYSQKLPSPPWEGMKGRGDQTSFVHPHPCLPAGRLTLPRRKGEGIIGEISNIFD